MARILIVDDDENLLHVLGEYLETVGLENDLAVCVEQARNRLKRSRYDLVVSDFKMPGRIRPRSSRLRLTHVPGYTIYPDDRV